MEEDFIKKQKKSNRLAIIALGFLYISCIASIIVGFQLGKRTTDGFRESLNFSLGIRAEEVTTAVGEPDYIFQPGEEIELEAYDFTREFPGLVYCYEYAFHMYVIYFDENGKSMCIRYFSTSSLSWWSSNVVAEGMRETEQDL